MKEVSDKEVLVKRNNGKYVAFRRSSPEYCAEGDSAKEARSNLSRKEFSDLCDAIRESVE